MSLLRSVLTAERRGADPTQPWGSSYIPTNGQVGFVSAGVPMNDDTSLAIATVYTCISILADSVATLPLVPIRTGKDGIRRKDDGASQLLTNPWPEGTLGEWLGQAMVSLCLRGNFYGTVEDRDPRGWPTMIMPWHPDRVSAARDRTTGKRVYRFDGVVRPTADVFHVPAFQAPGSFVGINPVEYARTSWALAAAAEKYGSQYFANSANPSGIIMIDGDLSEEETIELVRSWKMAHGGLGNAQFPAVLTGGARWQQIAINPDDAQFLATRQYQREEILAYFRIPPHKVGLVDRTPPTATGLESTEIMFVTDTLLPWLSRLAQNLTRITPRPLEAKFDLSGRLRGNTLERFQAYQIARNGGWFNVNEIRIKEDLEPIGAAGDIYLQPVNMAPLGTPPSGTAQPPNDSGLVGGGGNPSSSPDPTKPDAII